MKYEALTPQQLLQIVDGRLAQYEAQHYETSLNRMTLEQANDVSPEDKAQQLEQMERVLKSLESSIALHRQERSRHGSGAGGGADA